eukprot:PhF_6_TR9443/c0_g1_i1/m.14757
MDEVQMDTCGAVSLSPAPTPVIQISSSRWCTCLTSYQSKFLIVTLLNTILTVFLTLELISSLDTDKVCCGPNTCNWKSLPPNSIKTNDDGMCVLQDTTETGACVQQLQKYKLETMGVPCYVGPCYLPKTPQEACREAKPQRVSPNGYTWIVAIMLVIASWCVLIALGCCDALTLDHEPLVGIILLHGPAAIVTAVVFTVQSGKSMDPMTEDAKLSLNTMAYFIDSKLVTGDHPLFVSYTDTDVMRVSLVYGWILVFFVLIQSYVTFWSFRALCLE